MTSKRCGTFESNIQMPYIHPSKDMMFSAFKKLTRIGCSLQIVLFAPITHCPCLITGGSHEGRMHHVHEQLAGCVRPTKNEICSYKFITPFIWSTSIDGFK